MEKLVGVKYQWSGKVLGKVTILTEPRVGFMFNKFGKVTNTKTCLVRCKCGSKHEVRFKYISQDYSGKCPVCGQSNMRKAPVGRTKSLFGYWMSQWNPTTHKPCTYKLPFFKGIVGEEYIAGFCYVDKDTYNYFIKVMCIKPKKYVQANMSRDNMERLGLLYKGCRSTKAMFVHRYHICKHSEAADHINGVSLDNRGSNLREATVRQNNVNTNKYKESNTGFRGVKFRDHKRKVKGKGEHKKIRPTKHYRASITYNKTDIGSSFYSLEEAVEYRDTLNLMINKEFAYLNVPEKEQYYKDNANSILLDKHLLFLEEEGL